MSGRGYVKRNLPSCFTNSFGTLDHFKVDCKAEELTQGQHLVITMMDTSLEKDSQSSSVLRVYYEPPTWYFCEPSVTIISLYTIKLRGEGDFRHPSLLHDDVMPRSNELDFSQYNIHLSSGKSRDRLTTFFVHVETCRNLLYVVE